MKKLLLLLSVVIAGCGGGGGSGPTPSPSQFFIKAPSVVYPTSYENMKNIGYGQITFPSLPAPSNNSCDYCNTPFAYGLANFSGKGNLDLFVIKAIYTKTNLTEATMLFYEQNGYGGWNVINLLTNDSESCLHPRKALIADFNQDGKPDIFVACHGYDYDPYPGESSLLILSQPDGKYKSKKTAFSGYMHGATAADLNGDGYPDLIIAGDFTSTKLETVGAINVFLNDKKGGFTMAPPNTYYSELNQGNANNNIFNGVFSVELIDVNDDKKPDLLIGYSSGVGASLTLNDGANHFVVQSSNFIPSELGYGWAVDFTFIKNGTDRVLYIDKTGDGTTSRAGFYDGTYVQKYNLTTNISTVLRNTSTGTSNLGQWTAWFVPTSDNSGITPYYYSKNNNYKLN